jgi:hypothetical protein
MCPCNSLRIGAAMLAFAFCMATAGQLVPGVSLQTLIAAALHGEMSLVMWLCVGFGAVGVWQFVAGLRAALTHDDPVSGWSLLLSSSALVLTLQTADIWGNAHGLHLSLYGAAAVRATAYAVMAGSVANLWLNLRGTLGVLLAGCDWLLRTVLFGPQPSFHDVEPEETPADVARRYLELQRRNNELEGELARLSAATRDAEKVLLFPGVARAVKAVLHPDRAKTDAERIAATERAQFASEVLESIGAR